MECGRTQPGIQSEYSKRTYLDAAVKFTIYGVVT